MSNQYSNISQYKNLWIGEIDNWMNEDYLHKCLTSYNIDVKNIKLIRDKTSGQLLGYGFLEFDTKEAASNALLLLSNKQMPNSNKLFKLNWASYSSNKLSSNQGTPQASGEYSIYVCELDPSITDDQLKTYFSQIYKSVFGAKIIVDPFTKISKGYGFVKFGSEEESQRALVEMNGKSIKGKPIKTNQASFKKEKYGNANMNNKMDNSNNMNMSNTNDPNQGYVDQYGHLYYNQTPTDPNLNAYNPMVAMQNYYNSFYMINGYYPTYNMNQMYYQNPMGGYYPQAQNQAQAQPQGNKDIVEGVGQNEHTVNGIIKEEKK